MTSGAAVHAAKKMLRKKLKGRLSAMTPVERKQQSAEVLKQVGDA